MLRRSTLSAELRLIDNHRVDSDGVCYLVLQNFGFIPWYPCLKYPWNRNLMKICDLDDDTLLVIFSFLPVKAILAMRQVCRLQDL